MNTKTSPDQSMDDQDYDSPASPASFTSSGLRTGKPKRLNHNELERKRRHHQKERLTELKDAIPTLQQEKPSTVLIMQKAKEYIDVLKKRCDEMEREMDRMRQALMQLTAQNQNQRAMMQQPSGYRGQEEMESEALLRENLELRNQLLQLERKYSGLGKPVDLHHAKSDWPQKSTAKNMNSIGVDSLNGMNLWPMPGPIANMSQPQHSQQDMPSHNHVSRNQATTDLPSQPINRPPQPPPNHSNPLPAGDRLVGGMNPPPSSMSLGHNGLNVTPVDHSSVHFQTSNQVSSDLNAPLHHNPSLDMSLHLRKRQSLVDYEFNDMQQGFYERRNSTIQALEAMRETQSHTMHPSNSTPTARQILSSNSPVLHHSTGSVATDKRNVLPSLMLPMLPSDTTAMHAVEEETYAGEEVKCRVCNGGLAGLIMLDCDRCHNWYHGQCVGVDSKKIPSSWICNPCLSG